MAGGTCRWVFTTGAFQHGSSRKRFDLASCVSQCAISAECDSGRVNEFGLNSDEIEKSGEIAFRMFEGTVAVIAAAGESDNHPFPGQQSLGPRLRIAEAAPGDGQPIEPRLKLGRGVPTKRSAKAGESDIVAIEIPPSSGDCRRGDSP